MKVAHKNADEVGDPADLPGKARALESQGEWEKAAASYQKIIKQNPLQEQAYDRLMIIFRKNLEYKKEKAIIESGIKAFQEFYDRSLKLPPTPKIKTLSKAIAKAMGLTDQKGKAVYERQPIGRWRRRLELVKKKLAQR